MSRSRPGDPDSSLPQTTKIEGARSAHFVINPLVSHVRANKQSAMDFTIEGFKRHRVTAIGEHHSPTFSASGPENGVVRMFMRDLCNALHADADARFRFLAVELDEAAVVARFGDWQAIVLPPGVVNRKAHWLAEVVAPRAALREIFRAIARMPEDQVEVALIDHRVDELAYDRVGDYMNWLFGGDLQQNADETPEQFEQRRNQTLDERQPDYTRRSLERDTVAATNFERMVLDRLGDGRALIYYGANHLREGPSDLGGHYYSGMTNNNLIRQLIERENGLSADDIYTIESVFPGMARLVRTISVRQLRREHAHEIQLLRIFDLLRAEFPDDHNIGFDVDDAQFAFRPIDRSATYPLGERFDGCIYFRDLNSWDGQTQPPAEAIAQADAVPDISVTSVIPGRASPGNTIFVYGFVLTVDTQVTVVTRSGGQTSQFQCTDVVCLNENLISARVPMPGSYPVGGQEAHIQISRPGAPNPDKPAELLSAFRYVIP